MLKNESVAGAKASGVHYSSSIVKCDNIRVYLEVLFVAQAEIMEKMPQFSAGHSIRLVLELYASESPTTAENFLRLCRGCGESKRSDLLTYKGTEFTRIVPGFIAQGGSLTDRGNVLSAFGCRFNDEHMKRSHRVGSLSMANNGPNTQASEFFITLSDDCKANFDGKHCCFGQVVSGMEDFLARIDGLAAQLRGHSLEKDGALPIRVVIQSCGQL